MNEPLSYIIRFFRWFCRPDYVDDIEGDLLERYYKHNENKGQLIANLSLFLEVMRLLRPGVIKEWGGSQKLNTYGMFKNYFKTSYRTLLRHKVYTSINVLGFSLGMGIAIALYLIYQYENSFDNYHPDGDQIYQVMGYASTENGSHMPGGVVHTLKREFPEIEEAVTIHRLDPQVIKVNGQNLSIKNAYFVDPEVFDLLKIDWRVGAPSSSLATPNQVVLDASTAERLFPEQEAIGKVIDFDNQFTATVSGIIEDLPNNTEFPFKMIFPFAAHPWKWEVKRHKTYWGGGDSAFKALVKIKPGSDLKGIESRISEIGRRYDEFSYERIGFVPIEKVHLDPDNDPFNYYSPVWLTNWLLYIGLFLLAISCINFINLSTAHTISRRKGIVLRKILGSHRAGLLLQFMMETGLIVLVSLFIAIGFANFIVDYASRFFQTNIATDIFNSTEFLVFALAFWAGVTIVSGIYPSMVVSSNQLVAIFKERANPKNASLTLRQILIAFQFVITTIMIVAILVGTKQMTFLYSKDLGFKHENIVVTDIPEPRNEVKKARFQSLLLDNPNIERVSLGLSAPAAAQSSWSGDFESPLFSSELGTRILFVDPSYLSFYNMELIAGRNFLPSDTGQFVGVINREVTLAMGFTDPEEALGQSIEGWPGKFKVIGVIENYHDESLRSRISPQIMVYNPDNFYKANIEVNPNQRAAAVAFIERTWKEIYPDYYFNLKYLDDELKGQYESDNKFTNFLGLFAILSILIGSLGLYGLIYFVCLQKTKEIGIRKVLGAMAHQIVGSLSKAFVKPVMLSMIIAIPIAVYITNVYLSNYAFQADIEWFTYAMAGFLSIVVASVPIVLQARVAANQNPVESLKDE